MKLLIHVYKTYCDLYNLYLMFQNKCFSEADHFFTLFLKHAQLNTKSLIIYYICVIGLGLIIKFSEQSHTKKVNKLINFMCLKTHFMLFSLTSLFLVLQDFNIANAYYVYIYIFSLHLAVFVIKNELKTYLLQKIAK